MKLLPFQSFVNEDGLVVCPACLYEQNTAVTKYCTDMHPPNLPNVSITQFGDEALPHLHRSCTRCDFTWLEQTADLTGCPAV